MKPKQLLSLYIENFLVDELQRLGFRYAKSVPKFSRKQGDFELTFSFSLSTWNSENYCEFWTMWNIPGWTRNIQHFKLKNLECDKVEFSEFMHNVMNIGIPYYSQIDDWNTAADYATRSPIIFYEKVCDFYMMSGKEEKAKEILERGIQEIKDRKHDSNMQLPEIRNRLKEYFIQ
ncbi:MULTISPECIES: hypothetical protein [Bacillus cereus group]|uniref:DUF4304 domain-containing protein n=1 Tax=Bacillus cereus TaxID=1396 RepID=A0A2A8U0K2_BACCE|nr:hypothetical protein [Bacillus cereus]PDY81364.1 hypothetical protein CON06_16695 [Bacillus cereus]PFA11428.1 hypothetical protein CN382_19445 [Bacillus cereus]PFM32958.1 hypothetical protein COJ43_26535 [Bacillus cereus]PGL62041.1 hypothetical protein CN927_10295 [Bacillus cereus]PGQ08246.1 hypothetical protein COA08_15840 [Bacillus cereus]